jgi:hypothetical protein
VEVAGLVGSQYGPFKLAQFDSYSVEGGVKLKRRGAVVGVGVVRGFLVNN